jgi:hypothetical protein
MRLSFIAIFCFCILSSNSSHSQNCNCSSNFQWLKKTFEENDAGFKYHLSVKGWDFYDYHNKAIQEKINQVKTGNGCFKPLLVFRALAVVVCFEADREFHIC